MSANASCVKNGINHEKKYTPPKGKGEIISKHDFIKYCRIKNIEVDKIWSKKFLPDIAVVRENKLFIIEQKYQQVAGSADEKLQTAPFKKWQYERLGFEVKFAYLCNDWFEQSCYLNLREYLSLQGVELFIDNVPESWWD